MKQLLQRALDALSPLTGDGDRELCDAIRDAIAQPAPGPVVVAWAEEFRNSVLHQRGPLAENGMTGDQVNDVLALFDDLYTPPAVAEPQAEPVAWTTMPEAHSWEFVSGRADPNGKLLGVWHPLYAEPPAVAEPVEMDDLQIDHIVENSEGKWSEDVFCVEGPALADMLRAAYSVGRAVPQAQPAVAEPLTDEDAVEWLVQSGCLPGTDYGSFIQGVRWAEQAHGIGIKETKK